VFVFIPHQSGTPTQAFIDRRVEINYGTRSHLPIFRARTKEMEMVSNMRHVLIGLVFLSMAVPAAAQSQSLAQASDQARKGPAVDSAHRADIERLMETTGASALGAQMASTVSDAFLNGFKQTQQVIPPRVIEVVREVLNTEFEQAFNGGEMKDRQTALYAKYFTHDDVKGLLTFYQTDLGRKAIAAMPNLAREGAAIGEQWARANMPRVLGVLETRLKAEGLIPETATLR
jgi:hypothetical protein